VLEAKRGRPWLGPRGQVVNSNLITDLVEGNAGEAFYQVEVLG
jgi:hypothetical protein